jgi:hypothetical protein
MANDNQGSRTFLAIVLGGIVLALVIAASFMYGHEGDTDVKEQPVTEQPAPPPAETPPAEPPAAETPPAEPPAAEMPPAEPPAAETPAPEESPAPENP